MIERTTGDILKADVEALVNSVNCVGVMGRGIALQFKNAFPDNFKAYAAACSRKEVQPGRMFVFETGYLGNPRYIINFPTKRHWRGPSRLEDIEVGLVALVAEIRARDIRSIAIPPLGAGLGGLNWQEVRPRIEAAMQELDEVRAVVFEPDGPPAPQRRAPSQETPRMTPGRAALIGLIYRYLAGSLDPFVTLLEVHKLMYFMQEAGEALRLRYTQALYGPYAENLRHVLLAMEGHYLVGYADGGDAPGKELTLVPGATEEAEIFLARHSDSLARFERVVELVEGFETPFGLELLSTVHWVATREGARTAEEARTYAYNWNERKRHFTQRQIFLTWDVLQTKGWLAGLGARGR